MDSSKEIEKKLRKWKDLKLAGDILLGIGGTGFVGSVLSPFDFEGPVIEILTGILALIGLILKKVGENNIADILGQERGSWTSDDRKELENIKKNIEDTTKKRKEIKSNKKSLLK